MMKKRIAVLLACVLLMLGACGKKEAGADYYEPSYHSAKPASDMYTTVSLASEAHVPSYEKDGGNGTVSDEKLVYTGYVRMETKDYDKMNEELDSLFAKYRVVTQSTNEVSSSSGRRKLVMTVRVPAEHFDEFLSGLRGGSGSILEISTDVDNITEEYNNNDLEITALTTQHERLLQLLDTAATLEDIILLEQRLSEVELRLTRLNQYKNSMDADVRYSTVSMEVGEVQTYSETGFLQKIGNAFSGSWSNFTDGVENFIIGLIYALPLIVILTVLVLALRKPAVNAYRKRKERKQVQKTDK